MIDDWRIFFYPFGFISSLLFAARVLVQWIHSEARKESVVSRLFWKISFTGNILLLTHSMVQLQYHVCFVQTCNAIISLRNLNLMREEGEQKSFRFVVRCLISSLVTLTTVFFIQDQLFFSGGMEWFRVPEIPWLTISAGRVHPLWHFTGFIGLVLFSSRFWVQWWFAEQHKQSILPKQFWVLSLSGSVLSLVYFLKLGDIVNIIGPAFGIIPYIRNLVFIRKKEVIDHVYATKR